MQLNVSCGSQPALSLNLAVSLSNLKKAVYRSAGSGGVMLLKGAVSTHLWCIVQERPCRGWTTAVHEQQHVPGPHCNFWLNLHRSIDLEACPDVKKEDDRESVTFPGRYMFTWACCILDPLFCNRKACLPPEFPSPWMNLVMSILLVLPQIIPGF